MLALKSGCFPFSNLLPVAMLPSVYTSSEFSMWRFICPSACRRLKVILGHSVDILGTSGLWSVRKTTVFDGNNSNCASANTSGLLPDSRRNSGLHGSFGKLMAAFSLPHEQQFCCYFFKTPLSSYVPHISPSPL